MKKGKKEPGKKLQVNNIWTPTPSCLRCLFETGFERILQKSLYFRIIISFYFITLFCQKKSRRCCLFGLDLHFRQFVIWELSLVNCIVLFVFICKWSSRQTVLSSRISTSNISCVDKKKIVDTSRLFKWENLTIFFIVCKKNNLVSSFSFT